MKALEDHSRGFRPAPPEVPGNGVPGEDLELYEALAGTDLERALEARFRSCPEEPESCATVVQLSDYRSKKH